MSSPSPLHPSSLHAEIERIFGLQKANRWTVAQTSVHVRREKLKRLHDTILTRRADIQAALFADMRKPGPEVDLTEIFAVAGEARHAIRHLRGWMRPRRVGTPFAFFGSRSAIHYEAKGLTLIISPWNFPINLTFGPLVSAIAAGNCVVLKPSELTPNTTRCIGEIVASLFDENEVAVFEGDASVSAALLEQPFDHIFFTGSPAVGKIVMAAAAAHLTSVTLELGGKSPAIVDRSANAREAARKIAWGKYLNNGQTCVAPDYVLVDEAIRERFSSELRDAVDDLFGTEESVGESTAYGRVISDRHLTRVSALFDDAVSRGASVARGGAKRIGDRFFAPTILADVPPDSSVMTEEIFGPLLPIVPYDDIEEALCFIDTKGRPLALYIFSHDRRTIDRVMARTTAGGTMINDVGLHFFQSNLPFGGTGLSGFGKSHGRYGFEAFSNARGVMRQLTRFSGIQLMYPPYTKFARKLIDLTIRYF